MDESDFGTYYTSCNIYGRLARYRVKAVSNFR